MQRVAPVPESLRLPKRDAYQRAAARIRREVFDPDQAVTWPDSPDGSGDGTGVCQLVAECEFGCQHGAKHSVDRTYLFEAERLGAEVWPHQLVSHVRPDPAGYAVVHRDTATGTTRTVTGQRVVLAAGTLGTNEILLRSRERLRTLPDLSPALGRGFSANGDFLGSIEQADVDLDPSFGPDVTSVMRFFDEAPEFTMAAPTFDAGVMKVLASLGQPSARLLRPLAGVLWRVLPWLLPWSFAWGAFSRPSRLPPLHRGDPRRMTNLFAIGRDNANGVLRLGRRRLDIEWSYRRENGALLERMQVAMAQVADAYGGSFSPILTWKLFRRIFTVHPLGGCHLSDTPADGVVTAHGEVHHYPGLFVADGSVIPTAIGFHPVMTISAVAEHTAEAVAASY